MNIVHKPLNELTASEYRRCLRLNFGFDSGNMQAMLIDHRNSPFSRAILLYSGNVILGWALLVPTRHVDTAAWGIGRYGAKKSKYIVQIYVRSKQRGKGYGKMLMNAVGEHDTCPYVWAHDEASGGLYKDYNVTTARDMRSEFLKKKGKVAA